MAGLATLILPQIQEKETLTFHDQMQENPLEKVDVALHDDQTQESIDSDKEKNPCISEKINDLSTKFQMLKDEHAVLSKEVKGVIGESYPGTDLAAALESLGTKYETLKKKYLEESSERKRLYNEVIELKGNIKVFCRCRPLSADEIAKGYSSVIDFDLSQETELQIICSDSSRKQFKFDHVFGPQDNQEAVFAQTSPIVTSVLDGFNVCIFAYGQTGTGKTFTMEGAPENRGVNYRTLEELFRISKDRASTMKYGLFVSMLEVYNEKIRDLLAESSQQPTKKLEIKQLAEGTQEVPGLVEAQVFSTDEVWELLKAGSTSRAVGSTNANQESSRSHCLLRVTVRGEGLVNGQRSKSHLWLVDLAGSERVGKIDVEGERLKESQCINKSLSALGDVISALACKNPHIPYRNSKLTHLLQSSLGGDCKTLMFVQISPSAGDLGETLCSLNFASRVRGIEHGPARKQPDHGDYLKYKQMADRLRQNEKESRKVQDSLHMLQLKFATREQLCRNLQEKVRELESQLADERKARLQQENRAAGKDQKGQAEKKPPLFPSNFRQPLRRITNTLPPSIPKRKSTILNPVKEEKENMSITKPTVSPTVNPPMRARRISLIPAVRRTSMQPRKRASIAVIQPEMHRLSSAHNTTTQYSHPNNGTAARPSLVRDPRRRSRIFSPLLESTTVDTPQSRRYSSSTSSASMPFSSPVQSSWRPKIPNVASPQPSRFAPSPLNLRALRNAQALNKFCLSVQRKVG